MSLSGKKVAMLIAQEYEDLEAWYPYLRLKEEGAEITLVGAKAGESYPSKHGYPMKSDAAAKDLDGADFDCIIVPGGFGPDFMRRSDDMIRFFKQAADAGKTVAAICHGVWMLCCVPEMLRGRRVTSYFSIRFDIANAGGQWVDQEVVVDGDIITSRNPNDLPAFCKAIIEHLSAVPAGV